MKFNRALIIGLSLFLFGCDSFGDKEWYEEEYSSEEDYYSDLEDDDEPGHLLRYKITKGQEYFDSGKLDIEMRATDQTIYLTVEVDLGDSVVFPMVYNKDFHKKEVAYSFGIHLTFESGKEHFTVFDGELMHDGKVRLYYEVLPSDFRYVSAGLHDFNLKIEGKFFSNFGDEAKETPIYAEAKLSYKVPDVYKSTFYFKALKLDKESVITMLGDNDGINSIPEPGIYVTHHNELIITGAGSNSFAYKEKLKADFYHLSPNDTIVVEVIDKDYFLNPSDNINEIWLPLKDLEGETYKRYSMEYVDELWVYCKQRGKAN